MPPPRRAVDRVRERLDDLVRRSRVPGLQYLCRDATGVHLTHHAGSADLAGHVPMDAATTLMAYSMSKPVTAAAALMLASEQRLDLDAPVQSVLRELPYREPFTARQLISHTSGLPNPIPLRWVHALAAHAAFDERAALDEVLSRHRRLAAPPGTRFAYSNLGYWLLGFLVEHAANEPFTAFVERRVLDPLGIPPVALGYRVVDPADHAYGYLERGSMLDWLRGVLVDPALVGEACGRWRRILGHYVNGAAFGGLVGSAAGWGRFLEDLLGDRSGILDDTARHRFFEPQRTIGGAPIPMTLGWHRGRLERTDHLYKEGGGAGFHAMTRLYPERGIATLLWVNATVFDVSRALDALDRPWLGAGALPD